MSTPPRKEDCRGGRPGDADRRIDPPPIEPGMSVGDLVGKHYLAYNAARLREASLVMSEKMLAGDGLVILTLAGALTPAGLGASCVVPLLEAGLVDVVISTGANLFHDLHHGLDLRLERGSPFGDDRELRRLRKVRIYDVILDFDVLDKTDWFVRDIVAAMPPDAIGTADLHNRLGRAVLDRAGTTGRADKSLLAVAARLDVPVYSASPGDSAIGMVVAARRLTGRGPVVDPSKDVNELAAFVWDAKRSGRTTGVVILGGGAPKNFALQTAPHLEEVLYLRRPGGFGLDYFVQFTDARPDTGGLSGATPSEAVSWGKLLPERIPDSVVCYVDATVAFPLVTAAVLDAGRRRAPKRLYAARAETVAALAAACAAK
ncbi:MAG: deoxyhypusine synthase [Myxococcota bacterium]|nr:deoxyhypusine synthase [Myxococcota bacterium]